MNYRKGVPSHLTSLWSVEFLSERNRPSRSVYAKTNFTPVAASVTVTKNAGMHRICITFIVCILLFTLQVATVVDGRDASSGPKNVSTKCSEREFDNCAATVLVFGKRSVYLPKNPQEMVPHCQEEFDAEKCVKKYARKCMDPLPRQLVSVLLHGASQVVHSRCKPRGVKEYLSHEPCLTRTIGELHDCMDQLVVALQLIQNLPKVSDRIPLACCSFARYQHCSAQPTKHKCKDDPGAPDYVSIKMIKGYASEVLDIACPGYEWEGQKCGALNVPDGGIQYRNGKIHFTPASNQTLKDKPASLIPPFISIFTKL